jgi:hypothetical protein
VRHARRITLDNVRLETEKSDARPAIVTEAADLRREP